MNLILRNILAVLLGIVIGTVINGWIISISGSIIPPPEGTDLTTTEGLQAALPLMEPKHFIMPFLAHGLGALLGAFMCATIAATHKMKFAMSIGCLFLLGGIAAASFIPAPTWFVVTDLVLAYIPMAWLGGKMASSSKS